MRFSSSAIVNILPRSLYPALARAFLGTAAMLAAIAVGNNVQAATDIMVWHAMEGPQAALFGDLAERYNQSQKEVHVTLEYKGKPLDTVNAAIDADTAQNRPDLLEVQDELSGHVLQTPNMAVPIHEVLALSKSLDFGFFLPGTITFMKDARGQLYGFPLRASVPVLFYNKDAFRKAGLDPETPPKTWTDLQQQLIALRNDAGFQCAYTTSYESWIHVENLSAWHGVPLATRNNGLDGSGAQVLFNDLLHVRHIAKLASWSSSGIFSHYGPDDEADDHFINGDCAVLTSTSATLARLMPEAKFAFGIAPLPFYVEGGQPVNTFVGGASLWAMQGKPKDHYKAAAAFLAYLSTPVIAAEWHQKTGNLPLTHAAWLASEKTGFYDKLPGLGPIMKMAATTPVPVTRGIRLPRPDKLRDVINAELEKVWSGKKPAKQALDDAVRIDNLVIREAEAKGQPACPTCNGGAMKGKKAHRK